MCEKQASPCVCMHVGTIVIYSILIFENVCMSSITVSHMARIASVHPHMVPPSLSLLGDIYFSLSLALACSTAVCICICIRLSVRSVFRIPGDVSPVPPALMPEH